MPHPFTSLALRPELLEALAAVGYAQMTPIQAASLPPLLAGRDVRGQAMTGSGKTAAFGLALLQVIDVERVAPQAIVLCPTRELADQVAGEIRRLAHRLPNLRIVTLCGGHPAREQVVALGRGAHVVVGTPGRLHDHLLRGSLDAEALRVLVLDEADRLLDLGFQEQVDAIVDALPRVRQTLLYSATFPPEVDALGARVQRDPVQVEAATQVEPDRLRQLVLIADGTSRKELVADLLAAYRPTSALVFCPTRDECDALAAFLVGLGAGALALHGQMEQRDRDDVLLQFANGSASVLVATDVAARGIDVQDLPAVIVAELAPDPELHLHRVGRTGRAGKEGLALTIVNTRAGHERLARVEALLGQRLERAPLPPPAGSLAYLTPPNRTLLLQAGRNEKLRKGDVLGALVKEGGIPVEAVGRIDVQPRTCTVAVARAYADAALRAVTTARVKGKKVRARLLG